MRKPRMNLEYFRARRGRLAQLVPGCAVVLPAWPEYIRNADAHHPYRVESNLFYLTGFEEPEACLVFRPGKVPETTVFVRPKNVERETWDGFRFGLDGAKKAFGFDECHSIHDFTHMAPELLRGCERVYYSLFRNEPFDAIFAKVMIAVHGWRPRFGQGLPPIEDAQSLIGELRMRKTEEEVEAMRRAAGISAEAHIELMKATKAGTTERALNGLFIKEVMARGASGEAYGSIVATGNNATTLHYRFNDATLEAGQLLLVDAGAEYLNYSGDITRTYPVNGRFSGVQKRVYEKLLRLQKDLIAMVKPGVLHASLQKYTCENVCQILVEEKILNGSPEENMRSGAYTKYYPHGVSHLLGLDTHDSGTLLSKGEARAMEPGWVLTIEPGLYFPANDTTIAEEFRGLGIRIEDDVLVTPDGHEVMSWGVPKEIDEMEALIGRSN